MIPETELPIPVIGKRIVAVGPRDDPRLPRQIPAQAGAAEKPLRRLECDPDRRPRQVLGVGETRRQAPVHPDERGGRARDRVARRQQPVQLRRDPRRAPRRKPDARAPAERAAGRIEAGRLPAELIPRVARPLHNLRDVLAANEIDEEVRLPRAAAARLIRGRQLDDAPQREGGLVLAEFRPDVIFRADIEVADVVARPVPIDQRVAIHDAADFGIVQENGPLVVAVDPRVDQERAEDLRPVLDPHGERAREVPDVGVALDEVRAAPIRAARPLTVRQHLRRRHKPQSSVAVERRRRRARVFAGRAGRGRLLGVGILSRGCPERLGLRARGCWCDRESERDYRGHEYMS